MSLVRVSGVTRRFTGREGGVTALADIELEIERGRYVCMVGPSGCGKSTLLLTLGGMLHPTEGSIHFDGKDLYSLTGAERARVRGGRIGFVFQLFHLVPYLDLIDNLRLAGGQLPHAPTRQKAAQLLEEVGLGHRARHRPNKCSAGERQRAAVARALLVEPELLLADEPTGNLDPENAEAVLELFGRYHAGGGTVVVVTHGREAQEHADEVLRLEAGRLVPSADISGADT